MDEAFTESFLTSKIFLRFLLPILIIISVRYLVKKLLD